MRSEEELVDEAEAGGTAAPAFRSDFRLPTSAFGRLLGVDFGAVRVGLAVCDPDRLVVSPLETHTRKSLEQDAAFFAALVKREQIVGLVVGLAISLNGSEGPKARECRAFGGWLGGVTGLPVAYQDERFTSAAADDLLRDAGLNPKQRKDRRDKLAATLILQGHLEAGCPPE